MTDQGPVITAVAAGGALGALARYGAGLAFPHDPGSFPLATLLVNVSGCLAIGVVIVVLTERSTAHRLARPFLATGVLGGFTTFSTYATDTHALLDAGRFGVAAAYLVGTLVAAVVATWLGMRLARAGSR